MSATRITAGWGAFAAGLALGVAGVDQGWCRWITSAFFVAATVALLAAYAPRLPVLNQVPGVGSPRLEATFWVDGHPDGSPRVRSGNGRTAMLHIGIRNRSRVDIHGAVVNVVMSEGIRRWKADHNGQPEGGGTWMRPTRERFGDDDAHEWKDYWADRRDFTGRDSVVWWFKVRFQRPGTYWLRLRISSTFLYEDFVRTMRIEVGELEGDLAGVDAIDEAIDEGEHLFAARPDVFTDDALQSNFAAWLFKTYKAVPDAYVESLRSAENVDPEWGKQVGRDYYREQMQAKLAVLYEVRRRMASQ